MQPLWKLEWESRKNSKPSNKTKHNIELPRDTWPRDISLGNLLSDPKSCHRDSWTSVFTAALFKIARKILDALQQMSTQNSCNSGDSSVSRVLAAQVWGSEFRFPELILKGQVQQHTFLPELVIQRQEEPWFFLISYKFRYRCWFQK